MLLVNVYLIIYLHQTSSFSVVHTYSGPLTIILVTISVSAKIWKKNNLGKFHYLPQIVGQKKIALLALIQIQQCTSLHYFFYFQSTVI